MLIFGCNDFAEMIYESIRRGCSTHEYEVEGFVIDDAYYEAPLYCGKPVYRYSELDSQFVREDIRILICVGYSNMNANRKEIFGRLTRDGWNIASYFDKMAIIRTDNLGIGNIVCDGANIGIKSKIGNGNIFYPGALFAHHSTAGDFNFFAISSSVAGHVSVGNQCFFGNNSSTRDKITIADKNLIGAGCYLNHNVQVSGRVYVSNRCVELADRTADEML